MSDNNFEEQSDKPFRDRTRGKSRYIRRALVRIFLMTPEERKKYKPVDGFEEAAIAHHERCLDGRSGTAALTFAMNALGEATSKNEKPLASDGTAFTVVDDLPRSTKKPVQ